MSTAGKGLKKDECLALQQSLYACTLQHGLAGKPPVFLSRAAPTEEFELMQRDWKLAHKLAGADIGDESDLGKSLPKAAGGASDKGHH